MTTITPASSASAVAAVTPDMSTSDGSTSQTFTPFSGLALEFNADLEYASVEIAEKQTRKVLKGKEGRPQYLPGQPRIRLGKKAHIVGGRDPLLDYLERCHLTKQLDELLPYMRYVFVQTPSFNHITPLHHQGSHAREIKVTEQPGLHLVWYYELIFIKPIPAYFYSRAFWVYLDNPSTEELRRACLGFMRSYYWLIQYELDFHKACELRLIPPKDTGERPTYEEWCEFIEPFGRVGDHYVNRRYHYGELRLTRINRAALFKGSLAYFHIYPQWGSFLEHTLAPIITIFAVCSVVLNSMQVSLAAIEVGGELQLPPPSGPWPRFLDASLWFPIVVMLCFAVVLIASLLGLCFMGLKDLFRGNEVRQRKKRGEMGAGTRSHGMVW